MACVLKSLKLYGVRSFDKKENQSPFYEIKFHPQMTIINGRNGSGKTTLIEALVFGLTGKLSASPEGLPSFINGLGTGQVAQILITLNKGDDSYEIEWSLRRPNIEITGTCKITCNGNLIYERLWKKLVKEGEPFIRGILNLPSGAIEKLLIVPQEDTFWPFGTAKPVKEVIDKLLGLEADNLDIEKLVAKRKTLTDELAEQNRLLNPTSEKAALKAQAENENKAALAERERFGITKSKLEEETGNLEHQLKSYNEIRDLEIKLQAAENITQVLKISTDEISSVNQESLDKNLCELRNEILVNENELSKKINLKKELVTQLQEISDKYNNSNTRAQMKQESAQESRLKLENMSQSLSQDSLHFEKDVSLKFEQLDEKQKRIEDEFNNFLASINENERKKAQIETLLQENDKQVTNETENIAKLKSNLATYAVQERKLSILDKKLSEFDERIKCHTFKRKSQIADVPLPDLYETKISDALAAAEELGSAKGRLDMNQMFLEELQRCQSAEMSIIFQGRINERNRLQQTVTMLKELFIEKLESLNSVKTILFEELRLQLVSDIVERYKVTSNETDQENGKPAKIPKHDGLSGLAVLEAEIYLKQNYVKSLQAARPIQKAQHEEIIQKINEINESVKHNRINYQQLLADVNTVNCSLKEFQTLKSEAENFTNFDETNKILDAHRTLIKELKNNLLDVDMRIESISGSLTGLKTQLEKHNHLQEALTKIVDLNKAKTNLQAANSVITAQGLNPFPDFTTLTDHLSNLQCKLTQNQFEVKITSIKYAEATTQVKESQKNIGKFPNASSILKTLKTTIANLQNEIKQTETDEKEKRNQIISKHQEMLEVINQYLQDHWGVLYPHDDIPKILLEGAIKSEGAIRVDYTYHFKMQACGNEGQLQMRGRSSYGEKILASLIIRCALAEKFATGCPIVAFDDPQGCLDQELVGKLADHFSTITGSNQVIVTSHSEEFCEELCVKCDADYFMYDVKKENGCSTITKRGE